MDWTKGALESQDWAVRHAAAGVLSDLPEKQAMPLPRIGPAINDVLVIPSHGHPGAVGLQDISYVSSADVLAPERSSAGAGPTGLSN